VSRYYRLFYGIGFVPWEHESPSALDHVRTLFAEVERERVRPYGRALDLGCGTGRWSVELARRGWSVTGIDVVPAALDRAKRQARTAGVELELLEGDVTALRAAGVEPGVSLFLDAECFNHLDDEQRLAVGREVDATAAADASLLLLLWRRAKRGPFPPGAGPDDLAAAFPGWRTVDEQPYVGELPRPLRRIDPCWYRLTRNGRGPSSTRS
jgi:SAM-dependent methyltransferase